MSLHRSFEKELVIILLWKSCFSV